MICIEYNGKNDTITKVVNITNSLFTSKEFNEGVSKLKEFHLADIAPKEILDMIYNTDLQLTIDLYWPVPFTSNAYGYDDKHKEPVIHINRLTLNRPMHSICNTIVHQAVHALNTAHENFSFGHGDDNPDGKEYTAPYFIAGVAQKLAASEDVNCDAMQHEAAENIPLIEQKDMKLLQQQLIAEGLFCTYDHIAVLQA